MRGSSWNGIFWKCVFLPLRHLRAGRKDSPACSGKRANGPGDTRGDWGFTRATETTRRASIAVCLSTSINARYLTLRGEQGRFAQEERARPLLLFRNGAVPSWACASPAYRPRILTRVHCRRSVFAQPGSRMSLLRCLRDVRLSPNNGAKSGHRERSGRTQRGHRPVVPDVPQRVVQIDLVDRKTAHSVRVKP